MDAQALVARLARGGEAIRALVAQVDDAEARWIPATGGWSILDVVSHLRDEETEDFRQRLRLTLEEPAKEWPKLDPEARVLKIRGEGLSLGAEVAAFLAERRKSLEWLRGLRNPDWSRARVHPRMGSMAAGDLLAAWVAHDLLHVRQIAKVQYEHACSLAAPFKADYAGTPPTPPRR
jgi:hypothetical protein